MPEIKAQSNEVKMNLSIEHSSKKRSADGSVTVEILNGSGPFSYYISLTPTPTKDSDIIFQKKDDSSGKHVFTGLSIGKYYLIATDNNNRFAIEKISIDKKQKQ